MAVKFNTIKLYLLAITMIISLFGMFNSIAENGEDTDEDGLPDDWEIIHFGDITLYSSQDDPDIDGLNNSQEYQGGTDPTNADTDDDGIPDGWEVLYGLNPTDDQDAQKDPDDDGLNNLEEYQAGTKPTISDSDADGIPDWWEVQYGLNPNDPNDAAQDLDNDGYSNADEYKMMTDPYDKTSPPKKKEDADGGADMAMDSSALLIVIFIVPSIVILLAIIFVYTKMRREQLLEHKVRAQIFEYVNKNPGTHYRGIMNQLNLHMGVLTHHLNMLEQEQYIKSFQDGMYRRFYPKDAVIQPKLILNEVQHRILKLIQSIPGVSQVSLAKNLKVTTKVVNYHVKILANAGFVHVQQVGRETQLYYLDGLDIDTAPGPEGVSSPKAAA